MPKSVFRASQLSAAPEPSSPPPAAQPSDHVQPVDGWASPFPFPCPALSLPSPSPAVRLEPPASPATVLATTVPAPSAMQSLPAIPNATVLPTLLDRVGAAHRINQIKSWTGPNQQVLGIYLARLLLTEGGENGQLGAALCKRLRHLLDAVCRLPIFRQEAIDLLLESAVTDGEHVIRGLDGAEFALSVNQALAAPAGQATLQLVHLGYCAMRLKSVHDQAALCLASMPGKHRSEVLFIFETQLRNRLGLPGSTIPTKPIPRVLKRKLEVAADIAEKQSGNAALARAFFSKWPPWQQLRALHLEKSVPPAGMARQNVSGSDIGSRP